MKDLEFLTTIEDVKAVAKLLLENDHDFTGWKFLDKYCVEVNRSKLPYQIKWRLLMEIEYHGQPIIREFILDGDFNGKLEHDKPSDNSKYETEPFTDNRDYRSFEIFMDNESPVVKTTWHFPNVKWEESKHFQHRGHIITFDDKPVVFLNKDKIHKMLDCKTKTIEAKLVNGLPKWIDKRCDDLIFAMSPHVSYDSDLLWPTWHPIRGKIKLEELIIGKEYPLYRVGDRADILTTNLLSVKFDGTSFELIRPSESSLIK